jgi:molecular chaperone DnaK
VQVRPASGLTEAQIQRMIEEADAHAAADAERKQLIEYRNQAEGLIYSTERSIDEYGDVLSPLDIEEIRADVETLKVALDTVDPEELQLAIANLEQSAYRIADAMYNEAAEVAEE